MPRARRSCLLPALLLLAAATVAAQSRETIWFGAAGGVDVPLFGAARYTTAGPMVGVTAGIRIPALSFLVAELEVGGLLDPVAGGGTLTGPEALARIGVEFPPGGRFTARVYGLGGYIQGILLGAAQYSYVTGGSILGGGGVSARFRITDAWSLVAAVEGWTAVGVGPYLRASAGVRLHPVVRGLKPLAYELEALSAIEVARIDVDGLFPVLYEYYEARPLGRVSVTNASRKPLSNLTVSFYVEDHMDAPVPCPAADRLAPGESTTIDLHALFSETVLSMTERTRVTAKVLFDYTVEIWDLHQEATQSMDLYARNEITWDDDRRAAAFVTTRDPAVLQFARNTASRVEAVGSEAVNWNLRMAMALFESLRLYGMAYVVDPSLPYDKVSAQSGAVDFLQFPRETLQYLTGDCDDLSILYCSLLQALDVDTAFVTTPGHIYAAVSLGVSPDEAKRLFSRTDDLVFHDEDTWLPVEITALNGSFLEAWALGAEEWRKAAADGTQGFHPVQEAWGEYKPVGIPGQELALTMPATTTFEMVYGAELAGYVAREIDPQVRELKARIAVSQDKAKDNNRLGVLYARYGMNQEALEVFDQILRTRDYLPAVVNKANLLFLEGAYREALGLYQRALGLQPDGSIALLGVARCQFALRAYTRVAEPFERLKVLNPDLAARYPYLDTTSAGPTRAAEAGAQTRSVPWEYGE